jgi:hypothetical protein
MAAVPGPCAFISRSLSLSLPISRTRGLPSSARLPSSVTRMRSTLIDRPRGAIVVSVATIARHRARGQRACQLKGYALLRAFPLRIPETPARILRARSGSRVKRCIDHVRRLGHRSTLAAWTCEGSDEVLGDRLEAIDRPRITKSISPGRGAGNHRIAGAGSAAWLCLMSWSAETFTISPRTTIYKVGLKWSGLPSLTFAAIPSCGGVSGSIAPENTDLDTDARAPG